MIDPAAVLTECMLPGLAHVARGKVREMFAGDGSLLIVTTDRLSAFDVVMANGIPFKGKVLNRLSDFLVPATRSVHAWAPPAPGGAAEPVPRVLIGPIFSAFVLFLPKGGTAEIHRMGVDGQSEAVQRPDKDPSRPMWPSAVADIH